MNAVDLEMLLEPPPAEASAARANPSDIAFFRAVPVTTKLPAALVWWAYWERAGRCGGWSFLTTREVKEITGLSDYSLEWGINSLRSSGYLTQNQLLPTPQGSRWARRVYCPIAKSWEAAA